MKNLIVAGLLGLAPLAAFAVCGPACQANAMAMFHGPTHYTLRVGDQAHAQISVTWTSKHRSRLKPVRYEGVAPTRLRSTSVHGFEMLDEDVCNGVLTLIEQHRRDDDFDVYQVPVHNTECN
jgi:hypothetical protein